MEKISRWFVVGGVFTGINFDKIEPGTEVIVGPHTTLEAAEITQDGLMRRNLDICWYKVWVVEVNQSKMG